MCFKNLVKSGKGVSNSWPKKTIFGLVQIEGFTDDKTNAIQDQKFILREIENIMEKRDNVFCLIKDKIVKW